jgi:hypothetical protein
MSWSFRLEVSDELRGEPLPIGAHGRQRVGEAPYAVGERELALSVEGIGDIHPGRDHTFSGSASLVCAGSRIVRFAASSLTMLLSF